MSDLIPLDQILGPHQAGRLVRQLADDIVHQDHIDPDRALRIVCDRILAGDPLLIAAPGQIWTVHDDVEDHPARRLAILARLSEPARVVVFDPDLPDSEVDELLVEVLHLYQLESWHLPDDLLEDGDDR